MSTPSASDPARSPDTSRPPPAPITREKDISLEGTLGLPGKEG